MRVIRLLAILATVIILGIGAVLWAGVIAGSIAAIVVALLLVVLLDPPIRRFVTAWFVQRRVAVAVTAVLAIAGVAWFAAFGDPAHPFARRAPIGGPVEVGIEYRMTRSCGGVPFQLGDYVWDFVPPYEWPPRLPGDGMEPYSVPGTLTLSSPTEGVFVADVDGSRLEVTRVEPYRDDYPFLYCL